MPAIGSIVGIQTQQTGSGSLTTSGTTTFYTYSNSTPPTNSGSVRRVADNVDISYQTRSGATLTFKYEADVTLSSAVTAVAAAGDPVIGLYRDNEVNAIAWGRMPILKQLFATDAFGSAEHLTSPVQMRMAIEFDDVTAIDTDSHDYKVIFHSWGARNLLRFDVTALERRKFTVQEQF